MYPIKQIQDLKTIITLARYYSVAKKSHYDVLHLSRNCSDKDIKNAFITLSKEYHPDKNKDPNAQQLFVAVLEAYNVLGKPNRRAQYDRLMEHRPISTYTTYKSYDAAREPVYPSYKTKYYRPSSSSRKQNKNSFNNNTREASNSNDRKYYDFLHRHTINVNRTTFGNSFKSTKNKNDKTYRADASYRQQQSQYYSDYNYWNPENMTGSSRSHASSTYYGASGMAKVPNYVIILLCFGVTLVGTMLQVFVIRELYVVHRRQALERSKYLSEELERVRAAAVGNTNDVQTQLLMERIVTAANPTVATASLAQSLVNEEK